MIYVNILFSKALISKRVSLTSFQVVVKGRGKTHTLQCDGGITHQLTFQLNPELEVSSPPIPLSRAMADQVGEVPGYFPDIDVIWWLKCPSEHLPVSTSILPLLTQIIALDCHESMF